MILNNLYYSVCRIWINDLDDQCLKLYHSATIAITLNLYQLPFFYFPFYSSPYFFPSKHVLFFVFYNVVIFQLEHTAPTINESRFLYKKSFVLSFPRIFGKERKKGRDMKTIKSWTCYIINVIFLSFDFSRGKMLKKQCGYFWNNAVLKWQNDTECKDTFMVFF